TRLLDLARELGTLGAWVRLHYIYPYPHVDDLIPLMAEGKLLPYLDVPFQHASPRVLKLMKRPAAAADNLARIRAWRATCPEIAIRSTFIVGFPGETEAEFEQLLEFLRAAELDRVDCFTYSAVDGAAANALPDPVPEPLKQERQARLMELQAEISAARLHQRVGQTLTVLVDEIGANGAATARSMSDAPEIDGRVYVAAHPTLRAGEFAQVRVTRADAHDLWGDVVR
ncbi:MAG: radical SAM protein, partial [Gammaproteobacteria bacterium]